MADPAPDPDPQDEPQTPFERFEDLAKKLVKVPKREIDERRRGKPSDGSV